MCLWTLRLVSISVSVCWCWINFIVFTEHQRFILSCEDYNYKRIMDLPSWSLFGTSFYLEFELKMKFFFFFGKLFTKETIKEMNLSFKLFLISKFGETLPKVYWINWENLIKTSTILFFFSFGLKVEKLWLLKIF